MNAKVAVIFDLDGTLADTLDDIAASLNHALRTVAEGTHSREAVAGMVGDGVRVLVRRAVGVEDAALEQRVLAAFAEHYAKHCLDRTCLYPGIDVMLNRITAAGLGLAVLSNKPEAFTRRCCRALLGRWSFRCVVGAREGVPRKPDPAAALGIAAALDVPPERMVLVGDTPIDVATAHAAGMVPVAVTWGFRSRAELEAVSPGSIVTSAQELTSVLLGYASG